MHQAAARLGLACVQRLLQRTFGINQDVGDVLHAAHFMRAAPYFQQWVVGRRVGIGRVEQQAVREARTPTSGDLPVLTLDVLDDDRRGPRQQRRHHQAHALTGAGGAKVKTCFGPSWRR